jgi:predicted ATPase
MLSTRITFITGNNYVGSSSPLRCSISVWSENSSEKSLEGFVIGDFVWDILLQVCPR